MKTDSMKETVTELKGVPQPSTGAPLPLVIADEDQLRLFYLTNDRDGGGSFKHPVSVTTATEGRTVALVTFQHALIHMMGYPNDEVLSNHPLARLGLKHYTISEVHHSSWIRKLEQMNAVHPMHTAGSFDSYRHFIFPFHDSTFECIAEDFTVATYQGSLRGAVELVMTTDYLQ